MGCAVARAAPDRFESGGRFLIDERSANIEVAAGSLR